MFISQKRKGQKTSHRDATMHQSVSVVKTGELLDRCGVTQHTLSVSRDKPRTPRSWTWWWMNGTSESTCVVLPFGPLMQRPLQKLFAGSCGVNSWKMVSNFGTRSHKWVNSCLPADKMALWSFKPPFFFFFYNASTVRGRKQRGLKWEVRTCVMTKSESNKEWLCSTMTVSYLARLDLEILHSF